MRRSASREIVVGSIKDMLAPDLIYHSSSSQPELFASSVGGSSCSTRDAGALEGMAGSDSQQVTAIRRTLHQ